VFLRIFDSTLRAWLWTGLLSSAAVVIRILFIFLLALSLSISFDVCVFLFLFFLLIIGQRIGLGNFA
jgi:hypothetical protein